jgi:membrane peptidoglycan carboxypeptidase
VDGFRDCAGDLVGEAGGSWDVHNAESSKGGSEDMVTATWASTNTYYAQLEKDVGLCKVAKMAAKFGMTAPNGKPLSQVPAFTLGANEIDIVHEAAAYAGFAASGKYCSPIAIDSIADRNGKALPVPSANCSQVIDPDEANEVTSVLKGVLNDGAGTAHQYFDGLNGWDAAGKTGTTEGLANAVFAGYTRTLAAVVWEGDPEAPNGDPVNAYGASLVPTWQQTLENALAGTDVPDFPSPTGDYGTGGYSSGGNNNNQQGQGGQGGGAQPNPAKGGHGGKGGKGGKGGGHGGH